MSAPVCARRKWIWRTCELHPVEDDDSLLDPMLQPLDSVRIQPPRLVESTRRPSNARLDIVRTRPHLSLALRRHPVRAAVDLCRARRTCCGGVVESEPLDAEKAVVQQPFGKEALFGGDEGADGEVVGGVRGARGGLRLEGIFFFAVER